MTRTLSQHATPIPKSKGTYALILRLPAGRSIQVGKLGAFTFPAGYYLYTGSAFGPGGLAGRLNRHLAYDHSAKSRQWHVDYLRCWAPIVTIWYGEQNTPREHDWARLAGRLPDSSCPAPRFGASDCRCYSHLFHFSQPPIIEQFSKALNLTFPSDGPVQIIELTKKTSSGPKVGQIP